MAAGSPTPARAPAAPFDVAVSLIAHRVVHPSKADLARLTAAWMLGGPSVRSTKARYTAERAVALCRRLPLPETLRGAAGRLVDVALADTALADASQVSEQLRDRGLTRELVPLHGVLRLLQLWDASATGLEVRKGAHHSVLLDHRGRGWLAELTAATRRSGGPVRLASLPAGGHPSAELAADLLNCQLIGGWLCPITPGPPPTGLGYLVTRLLRITPQTVPDILAAASNQQVLDRRITRPPERVLRDWLAVQPWCDDNAGVISLSAEVQPRPHRLDDALAGALGRRPDRWTSHAELRQAILDAGYAPSGIRHLMLTSPIPERIGRSRYRLRGLHAETTR